MSLIHLLLLEKILEILQFSVFLPHLIDASTVRLSDYLKWYVWQKSEILRNIITLIIFTNQKTELCMYRWQHAHAWIDLTSFHICQDQENYFKC